MIKWESSLATGQQRSVMATFNTVLNQLEQDFLSSYHLLRILSFLDPEDIRLAMLTDGARMLSPLPGNSERESSMITRFAPWIHSRPHSQHSPCDPAEPSHSSPELRALVSLLLSPTVFPNALYKLRSLSLVERLSRDGELTLRVHDLVHFITQEHVKRHRGYQAWLKSTVSLVCAALRRVEDPTLPKCWPECEHLMPHVRFLSNAWTGKHGVNLELVMADVRLARYLNSRGRYDDAGRLCERSVGTFRKELGDKHKDTLSASYLLAHVYYNQGRTPQAEEAFKHVLAVRRRVLGADHEDTLMTMNNLALVYHKQDRYKEAEQLFKQVLSVEGKKLGPDHPSTLTTMHNLALVYGSQKQYDKAEELFEDVLARKERSLGPDHVNTLTAAINLGSLYESQSKYIYAEELFKRALVGRDKQLGPCHPHTLTAVLRLAYLYQSQVRNDEAEPLFRRAFEGMKEQLGANHPKTLDCAKAFSSFYRSRGRNREADALLEGH
jgi:tetratricopeptide (TPR) repeat protein